jgi:DNA-binding protein H-NS
MATLEIIQARIKKLQSQAEALIAQGAQGALDQIRELMIKHGLTTEDIERRAKARRERERKVRLGVSSGKAGIKAAVKGKLPPKYRDPKTGATWSGHARPPAWIKDVKDRSKFLIDAAAAAAEPAVTAKAVTKKAAAKKAVTAKSAGRKVAKKASAGAKAAVKKVAAKKAAAKSAGKKTAAKKVAAKSAAPTAGKRVIAKKAAAKKTSASKAPAKKAVAKKAPAKNVTSVVEAPVTAQASTPATGEA